ncbi:Uncharacterized conserved protein, DUF885 familyt [Sphingomonas sp. YR710]|uniref:DUF885 domain-containing protein n=1 Tax=Sphingomonas sp. YR710 TaxID=1882773 RepID=UPI00088E1C9D|nr:DUF885 family protein [Sphingomonas sp. YR710]SDC52248.1 Uncharacterized conserved protein, DUF885 familyt [Sphingomonas sp. YR710]
MNLNRRSFLLSAAAATGLAAIGRPAFAAIEPKFAKLLDDIAMQNLKDSPEGFSYLGLDTGANAWARAQLGDRSAAARAKTIADIPRFQNMLASIDRASLAGHDKLIYDSVAYELASGAAGSRFAYGGIGTFGGGNPYVISQQDGAYQGIPEFLDSVHRVENKADAEAYLSRLAALATALDQETEQAKHDAGLGVIAPDFVLDTTLEGLRGLRATPAKQARMVTSLVRRTDTKIPGDWAPRATKIVETMVYPALDRQIVAMAALRAKATHDAGAWKLPDGDAYYRWLLQYSTSTDLSPEAVHQMGLDQGRDLDARMDAVLKSQGMTQGTVGERMSALSRDPKQLFANTDAGKIEAVAYVKTKMNELRAMLPLVSRMKMKADVTVKRVPVDIEAGAALGYMNFASLDGSRPAIYYINLKDTGNWPKFTIPSLSAHEGLPGHTWQGAYVAEHRDDVPLIASLMGFNAYTEGWALYSEQLVDELGFYKEDPFGQLGMYQALRFRASRLVTDTGLHAKKWSREQAIDYLTSSTGRARAACTSEVDRYCASPGQACGYKVGHTQIVTLRDKAKAALGTRFDVRDFNDAVIQAGAVPLAVLATAIDDYVAKAKVA